MRVNLAQAVLGLNGKPAKENGEIVIMSKVVANSLVMQEVKDNLVMQRYELATKLFEADGEIEIAESERELIKKTCESGMLVLIAAQVLLIINNPIQDK